MMLALMVAALSFIACSSDDDDDGKNSDSLTMDYDILQINGVNYACCGYRCFVSYSSHWNPSNHSGEILLPCCTSSDAPKGKFEYDYFCKIILEANQDLKKGSKLENFSPRFVKGAIDWYALDYVSGTATITDLQTDEYITIKFDSFKCGNGDNSYILNGTVQLMFDENTKY